MALNINNLASNNLIMSLFRFNSWRLTVLLIIFVWLFDPAVDAYILNEGSFQQQLLAPEPIEIYFRLVISVMLLLMAIISRSAHRKINEEHLTLIEEQEKLQTIINSSPECVKSVAQDGTLTEMNPAGLKIIEADSSEQVCGESVYDLIAPEHRQRYIDFNNRIFSGHTEQIEYDIIGLNGTRKTVDSHAVPIYGESGEVISHLAITRDITQSRLMTDELNYQATHDMLTGLINRHEFERRLENSLKLSQSDQSVHAVFFIDLDQFKVINDTCGHIAGDQVLTDVANHLREHIRQQDCAARMGGDEFTILLEYCPLDEALNIAENIRSKIDEYHLLWEGRQYKISTSVGIVSIDNTITSADQILRNADAACYMAKEMGRNRIQVHQLDNEAIARHHGEMHWIAKIHDGIKQHRFILYAQTIEGLNDKSTDKHIEILLRYRDEDNNLLPPGAFLPAAERYSISPLIDRYVLSSTLSLLNDNPSMFNHAQQFAINLSGLSIANEEFLKFALQQFEQHPQLANKICFEITETVAISNLANAQLFIKNLNNIGCCFALDDFGSGLSSFAYLKNFPVDAVKIDGQFVRDIIDDPIDLAMVRSINDIAQLMGKKTIAEFVENDQIKKQLQLLGVNYVQGYGITKPFPLDNLITETAQFKSI